MTVLRPPHLDPRFVIEDFEPVYMETWRRGLLEEKVEDALRELEVRAAAIHLHLERAAGGGDQGSLDVHDSRAYSIQRWVGRAQSTPAAASRSGRISARRPAAS